MSHPDSEATAWSQIDPRARHRILALLERALLEGRVIDNLECPYDTDSDRWHFGVFEAANGALTFVVLAHPVQDFEEWIVITSPEVARLQLSGEELTLMASELSGQGLPASAARERLRELFSMAKDPRQLHALGRLLE